MLRCWLRIKIDYVDDHVPFELRECVLGRTSCMRAAVLHRIVAAFACKDLARVRGLSFVLCVLWQFELWVLKKI